MLAPARASGRGVLPRGCAAVSHRPAGVTLARVAQVVGGALTGDHTVVARGIRHDSRTIESGDVFLARRGEHADGLTFAEQAIARGACAIMAEAGHAPATAAVPILRVADARLALARAAALLYGDPTAELDTIGVTGTNGKTTTAYLVRHVLESTGHHPGVMGTLGVRWADRELHLQHNTPEADELTRIAAWMRDEGASHLILEVTSHALAQRRVDGVRFRVAAFTNLTPEHLDLHGTFEAYGRAKTRLFVDLRPELAVLVVDDELGASLSRRIDGPVLRVSLLDRGTADVRPAAPPRVDGHGIHCPIITPAGPATLASPLLGAHNLENLLAALGILVGLGVDPVRAAEALGTSPAVPGRLERCDGSADDIAVYVDYAHTPDALEKVLSALRPLTRGRLICVFGCGGDRDRSKRPLMGEAVGRGADVAVVTSDNPRTESPAAIAEQVLHGLGGLGADVVVELDRARAISWAIEQARPGDQVIVAGKGHETVQVVGTQPRPFDDRVHARGALARRRSSSHSERR